MAQITITIKDTLEVKAQDAVASLNGWTATVIDPVTQLDIPNPVTKAVFLKQWLKAKLRNEILEYDNRTALSAVVNEAL